MTLGNAMLRPRQRATEEPMGPPHAWRELTHMQSPMRSYVCIHCTRTLEQPRGSPDLEEGDGGICRGAR